MMNTLVIFSITLVLFFSGAHSAKVTVKNNCPYIIWPATLASGGSQLSTTGFELTVGAAKTITVPSPSGPVRFWARTQCNSAANFTCATGDCGTGQVACNGGGGDSPASLVELSIAAYNGQDFFDLSLVDGFNLPVSITPIGGNPGPNCTTVSCPSNINGLCPPELQVKGSNGSVSGCKSACLAFNVPQFCCTGDYSSPETCPQTEYSRILKKQCPKAYSYAFDDRTSTFSCTGGPNYAITFCPSGQSNECFREWIYE